MLIKSYSEIHSYKCDKCHVLEVNDFIKIVNPEGSVYWERVAIADSKRQIGVS